MIARLAPQKGHRVLFDALPAVLERVPDLRVRVVGHEELSTVAELRAYAASRGVAERVCFEGFRGDVAAVLRELDLFVLPSLWEGLSLALVEAMGAGRPIVATDVGGNPEVLQDDTGQLVRPNDVQALARAIERALGDEESARRMGTAAAKLARSKFSIEQHVCQIAALYRRGLAERNAAGRGHGRPTSPGAQAE